MSAVSQTIKKYILETVRDRGRLGILILAPIIFFSFFGFIFSSGGNGGLIYKIGIVNDDLSYDQNLSSVVPDEFDINGEITSLSEVFIEILIHKLSVLIDTKIDISVQFFDETENMIDATELGDIVLGVVVPSNFTRGILSGINQMMNSTIYSVENIDHISIETFGDQGISSYQNSLTLFTNALQQFIDYFLSVEVLLGDNPDGGYLFVSQTDIKFDEENPMDFFFPGFFAFLIILQAISVTALFTLEKENLTILRLKLSSIKAIELFAGYTIGQITTFSIQFLVSLVILSFWGINLTIRGIIFAFIISQLTNIVIIGISLIIASFSPDVQSATSITGIGSAPLGFLSGAFLPMTDVYLIKSINLQFWDFIPTYHTTQALTKIVLEDPSLFSLKRYIIALILFSIFLYTIGLYVYQKYVIDKDT